MFPAFYLPFLPVTDTFGIYMLLGSLWLLQAERCTHTVEGQPHEPSLIKKVYNGSQPFVLGILAGLMHLARADGLIWAGMTGVCILWGNKIQDWRKYTANLILSSFGYLLIMVPWLARNWVTFGTLLAPGAGRTLWMTGYNDLYLYPASLLTMERWLENGLTAVVQARTWALGQNLQTLLAVQGEIFLLPFIIWGLWHLRRLRLVRLGVLAWLFTFLVMTFVFPFAGARGGFFHSGAALQPFIFALVPSGLEQAITWAARKRGWLVGQAQRVFQLGALILAIFLTIVVAARRIDSAQTPGDPERYLRIESALVSLGASPDAIIMVNNPPGYYLSVGRPAIVIPSGDLGMVQAAARNYHSKYLLLEFNQLTGSDDLYGKPGDRAGLDYLTTVEDVRIYEFNEDVVP
jgi:hypothetical protein